MNNAVKSDQRALLTLLGGVGVLLLISLFNHPLYSSMEPRFVEAVREMVTQGQYLIPIKNGVPYIEYPPLYFWLCILGKFAGLPDAAAVRLPAAFALLFWIQGLFRLQKLLAPEWPPLLLPYVGVALPIVLINFFQAETDGVLALGVLIAMIGYCEHQMRSAELPAKFPWKFWLGATLAVAAKGPVGLVLTIFPVAADNIIAVFVAKQSAQMTEIWRRGFALFPLRGLALVLLVNGPWYLAAGLTVGWDFCKAVVIYQNFTRFFVGFDHLQPWWYYLKTISYDLFPYSLLLPFGLWFAWKNRSVFSFRFSAAWILTTVIFFSFSHSKQGKYLLPSAPAFALLGLLAVTQFKFPHSLAIRRVLWGMAYTILVVFVAANFWLAFSKKLGDSDAIHWRDLHSAVNPPGQVISYRWPHSPVLLEFGPLPCMHSSRDLYESIHSRKIHPGDYLLVDKRYISDMSKTNSLALNPAPAPPYFSFVTQSRVGSSTYHLYRVLPGAAFAPVPPTPEPPPVQWWEKFDTD